MDIRLGERVDGPRVAARLKELWLMHCGREPKYVSKKIIERYTQQEILRHLQNCFNKSGRSYLIIAEENEEIIGFLKADVEKIQKFF